MNYEVREKARAKSRVYHAEVKALRKEHSAKN
jgi:hypothetical protein